MEREERKFNSSNSKQFGLNSLLIPRMVRQRADNNNNNNDNDDIDSRINKNN